MINMNTKKFTSWDMDFFLEQILVSKLGVDENEIKHYFSFLQKIGNTAKSSVGGIIVNISKDGKATFLRFDDLFFMGKRIETEKEILIRERIELEKELERNQEIDYGMSR